MNSTTTTVAWIALLVALIALVLSWTAFNRSGVDVEQLVQEQVSEATAKMDAQYQQFEARVRADTAAGLRNSADTLDKAAADAATDSAPSTPGE